MLLLAEVNIYIVKPTQNVKVFLKHAVLQIHKTLHTSQTIKYWYICIWDIKKLNLKLYEDLSQSTHIYLILENDHINTEFGATVLQKQPDL